jgi:hypothetical protein
MLPDRAYRSQLQSSSRHSSVKPKRADARSEHALGGGHDFLPDSIARNHGDPVPPGHHDFGSLARSSGSGRDD